MVTSAPETLTPSAGSSGPLLGPSALVRGVRVLYSDDESGQLLVANTDGSQAIDTPSLVTPPTCVSPANPSVIDIIPCS